MKKKILSTAFAVVIMAVAGYNVYMNQEKNNLSELALANIEALADPEYNINEGKFGEVCGKKYGVCWIYGGFYYEGEYTRKVCNFIGLLTEYCNPI